MLDQATAAVLDDSTLADFGHGTMVAGVVHLVAPTAHIMPLKAFASDGTGYTSDIIRAIVYAGRSGANVLNMSFSRRTPSAELKRAIDNAAGLGVIHGRGHRRQLGPQLVGKGVLGQRDRLCQALRLRDPDDRRDRAQIQPAQELCADNGSHDYSDQHTGKAPHLCRRAAAAEQDEEVAEDDGDRDQDDRGPRPDKIRRQGHRDEGKSKAQGALHR